MPNPHSPLAPCHHPAMRACQFLLSVLPLAGLGSAHTHISGVPIPMIKALFSTVDPAFCASQTQAVGCLQGLAQGTPYCSSYLGIPTATLCSTVLVPNSALTGTVTSYVLPPTAAGKRAVEDERASVTIADRQITSILSPTVVAVRTEYNTPAEHRVLPRQAAAAAQQCLPAGQASAVSTNICECMNIPTPTSTTTYYQTLPPSVLVTRTVTTSMIPLATNAVSALRTGSLSTTTLPTTTLTIGYDGSTASTVTHAPLTSGAQVYTVVVILPRTTITQASFVTAPTTFIQTPAATGAQVITVLVATPLPTTTITSASLIATPTTITETPAPGDAQTVTVLVVTPFPSTTITQTSSVAAITTITETPAADGAQTVTVLVVKPALSTTTITQGYAGNTAATYTYFPASTGAQVVTVLLETPTPTATTTITVTYSGSAATTRTLTPSAGSGSRVVTVEVDAPASCETPGFNYAIYTNPYTRASATDPYKNFAPGYFAGAHALATGSYTGSFFFSDSTAHTSTVYNTTGVDLSQKAIDAVFYVYSPVAQQVTLSPRVYDIEYVYAGAAALTTPDTTHNVAYSLGGQVNTAGHLNTDGTISVAAGSYTPVRFVYGTAFMSEQETAYQSLVITGALQEVTIIRSSCHAAAALPVLD